MEYLVQCFFQIAEVFLFFLPEIIQGLSEHTVRQLVKQEKIKSIRTGEGIKGKILVNKADLLSYFQK